MIRQIEWPSGQNPSFDAKVCDHNRGHWRLLIVNYVIEIRKKYLAMSVTSTSDIEIYCK
jgi:hypothetical protein